MDYQDIVYSLLDLPSDIASQEGDLLEFRKGLKMAKTLLERRETEVLASRQDWGKNDGERKVNQKAALFADKNYLSLLGAVSDAEDNIAETEIEISRLKNLFYAMREIAALTAAHMVMDRTHTGAVVAQATATELGL
jgi:hypothetical protein